MTRGLRAIACCVLFLLQLVLAAAPAAAAQPLAVQGRIDLPLERPRAVQLAGEWGFAWHQFVDPAWQELPARAFTTVPSSWNDVTADGKLPGENGWGSYVLLVNCPAGRSLAVEAPGQRTASRLFVNGEQVAAHGTPGTSAAQGWAAVHRRVPITREFPCPLRITLHISNHDHRAGGFVRPLVAGPAEVLAERRESQVLDAAALLSAYVFTGLIALIFYAVRRRERTPLVYGLFCFAMALYTDMIGERLLLRGLGQQVSWFAYMRVEYLSWIAAMALFLLTLRGLFPLEMHRRVVLALLGALGVAAAAVLVLPPAVYSYVATPGQAIAVVVAVYVGSAMLRAQRRTAFDARVLQAGMVAILVALGIDLLLIDEPALARKYTPVGFAIFLLSPAVVIARRLSDALNAEERSRTLEENARLREDVERISRHDLKTPLGSILGVARLLAADTSLAREQRQLVDVLLQAGNRMLEMVNLSLGLFRMERGRYEFRPHGLDLREVAARAVLDLRPHAEAHGVDVVIAGPDSAPVYVRAEELLCYSIIANLVKNAIEAAGAGRQVTLRLARGERVALSVHNPGTVPPGVAGRFFEKYATSGKSGGTGLGAYSARLMALAQGGDLQMQTAPEDGTTLTLTLAALDDASQAAAAAAAPLPEPQEFGWLRAMPPCTVLLVDDDDATRLVTSRLLPRPPFVVEAVANGKQALAAMARRWPRCVLLDMEMPLLDGVQTLQWIRQQELAAGRPRCHVIMVSANDDRASLERALAAGADQFLVKPVSREELLTALGRMEGPGSTADGATAPADAPPAAGEPVAEPETVVPVNPEWVETFPRFVRSQQDNVETMATALAAGDRQQVRFLAHRAVGGLSLMGLHWAAGQVRRVEQGALQAPTAELQAALAGLREHLAQVRFVAAP